MSTPTLDRSLDADSLGIDETDYCLICGDEFPVDQLTYVRADLTNGHFDGRPGVCNRCLGKDDVERIWTHLALSLSAIAFTFGVGVAFVVGYAFPEGAGVLTNVSLFTLCFGIAVLAVDFHVDSFGVFR